MGGAERIDADMRLHLFESHLAVIAGDADAAVRHAESCLDAFTRYRDSSGQPEMAFADTEFDVRHAVLAALAYRGEPSSPGEVDAWRARRATHWARMIELQPYSARPQDREISLLLAAGDISRDAGDHPSARAAYQQAVTLSRRRPEFLGPALVSLASMEAATGDAKAAARTIARARKLVADQPALMARLHEAEMMAAGSRDDAATALASSAEYMELVDGAADAIPRSHRTEAAAGAGLRAHADGDFATAAEYFLSLAEQAGNDANRALMLLRAAVSRHEDAVAKRSADLRASALEILDRADDLLAGGAHPMLAANAVVARASMAANWPWTHADEYRALLPDIQAAAIALRHASFAMDTPQQRREYARTHATHAIELACRIAFVIGEPAHVAAMAEFAAATPALRAVGPSLLVGAPPRMTHLRELDEAYRRAGQRLGLPA